MIKRQELLEHSRELSLKPNVVEKDYALGWFLAGSEPIQPFNGFPHDCQLGTAKALSSTLFHEMRENYSSTMR